MSVDLDKITSSAVSPDPQFVTLNGPCCHDINVIWSCKFDANPTLINMKKKKIIPMSVALEPWNMFNSKPLYVTHSHKTRNKYYFT